MKFVGILFFVLVICSCATVQVDYDFDRGTDFKAYKTYNYYADLETGLSELDTRRLLNILDDALSSKGLSLSSEPDFYINILSNEYEDQNRNSVGIGIGGTGRNVGGGVSVGIPMQSRLKRQIQFDFIDENGPGLIWQAISESSFNPDSGPEEREMILRQVVEKVVKGFPPSIK